MPHLSFCCARSPLLRLPLRSPSELKRCTSEQERSPSEPERSPSKLKCCSLEQERSPFKLQMLHLYIQMPESRKGTASIGLFTTLKR
ncbi:MAG: hypothetical protein KME15_12835 [Drouetiella hepatica Uher 2000/2452]|uniref:Uncharacterized protein n=1 Tax=Drouetiella hepatica Uher 2000/2452 TaxID=904376 RepID=A0A951UN76_9CYAN|nr:hypothetical protein [Drouetiella hepatica Uher 2000/2452]